MDFSYTSYNKLISLIRKHGYAISDYNSWNKHDRSVILRHDVDYDLNKAVRFAEFENNIGVTSTYFVLLTSPLYNALSKEGRDAIIRINSLGHCIGLHYDETCYDSNDQIESNIIEEKDILGSIIGKPVDVFSMHRPSREILDRNIEITGMINCYSSGFFKDIKYISDSRRHWREPVESIIEEEKYDRIQILTHAFWYDEVSVTIQEAVSSFVNDGNLQRYNSMGENITDLAKIMSLREVR